jgi:hypothetical protein
MDLSRSLPSSAERDLFPASIPLVSRDYHSCLSVLGFRGASVTHRDRCTRHTYKAPPSVPGVCLWLVCEYESRHLDVSGYPCNVLWSVRAVQRSTEVLNERGESLEHSHLFALVQAGVDRGGGKVRVS